MCRIPWFCMPRDPEGQGDSCIPRDPEGHVSLRPEEFWPLMMWCIFLRMINKQGQIAVRGTEVPAEYANRDTSQVPGAPPQTPAPATALALGKTKSAGSLDRRFLKSKSPHTAPGSSNLQHIAIEIKDHRMPPLVCWGTSGYFLGSIALQMG